jgi:hypothetical protein
MKKFSLICLSVSLLTVSALDAAVYKGQREYVKKCRGCHGDGQKFLHSKEIAEWERMMDKKGKRLAEIHLDSDEAKKSWEYFKDSRYAKKAKDLRDFMTEYAADSGNVPACN